MIQLSRPDLPELSTLVPMLEDMWAEAKLSNFASLAQRFEIEAASYLGCGAAVVSSGTTGLILALQAVGIGPGDKVIIPSFTFSATGQAVICVGATPVFAEVDASLNMDVKDLEMLIETHRDIKCVMPVHMFGRPVEITDINDVIAALSRGNTIKTVYDAAHAFGSEINDFGTCSVFSLSSTKPLVAIEGGLVVSKDDELLSRIRAMRNYGIQSNYSATLTGLNGKFPEVNAAVGLLNLSLLPSRLRERRNLANVYREQIESRTRFRCQAPSKGMNFKIFCVLAPEDAPELRNLAIARLHDAGVETRTYFDPPLHNQPIFQPYSDRALPVTERLAQRVISLPFHSALKKSDINRIVDVLAGI